MWRLLIVACLLIFGSASANTKNTYHRVSGTGPNENAALQAAFVKAIEQESGTLILSERESNQYKLIQNDIIAFSSGYVDDFKIVSTERNNNSTTVIVDVKVSDSKIKNRILSNTSQANVFDGNKHSQQYNSFLEQRNQADRLLAQVFNQFPQKAFNVTYSQYTIELDTERNALIKIPFKFNWNSNFLIAVDELFKNIEDVKNFYDNHSGYVIVIVRKPGEYIGTQNRYRFNDMSILRQMNVILDNNEPMIKVKVFDRNRTTLHEGCVAPKYFLNSRNNETFYRIRSSDTAFIGNLDANGSVVLTIPPHLHGMLNSISNIELAVVSKNKCK